MWDFKPHCELPNYQQPHTQQPAHESWGKVRHASRGLRGTEYSFRFFCLGEKSTCLSTSSSLWRQDRNQAKEDLGGEGEHDTLHAGLEASCSKQKARKVSSSDTRQFSEFPRKSDTHAADCGLLGNSRVQHHTKNSEFIYHRHIHQTEGTVTTHC